MTLVACFCRCLEFLFRGCYVLDSMAQRVPWKLELAGYGRA